MQDSGLQKLRAASLEHLLLELNLLMENYLLYTDQQDGPSRAVLAYYLVEKAIVGAAISIVYDDLPDLGLSLLDIASMRRQCLVDGSVLI